MDSKLEGKNKLAKNLSYIEYTFINFGFTRSGYFYYSVLIVYTLIMLILVVTNRQIGDYGVESDFYSGYVPQAKEFLKGNLIIDPFKGPLYQIILGVTGFIFNDNLYLAGKVINVFSAGISLYLIFRIIGNLLGKDRAFFAILIIAVNLTFLRYTYETGTDMLFLVFYTSALFFILKKKIPESKDYFIAGIFSSLAYLTRYTGISLMVLLVFIFLYNFLRSSLFKNTDKSSVSLKPFLYFFIPVIIAISL